MPASAIECSEWQRRQHEKFHRLGSAFIHAGENPICLPQPCGRLHPIYHWPGGRPLAEATHDLRVAPDYLHPIYLLGML